MTAHWCIMQVGSDVMLYQSDLGGVLERSVFFKDFSREKASEVFDDLVKLAGRNPRAAGITPPMYVMTKGKWVEQTSVTIHEPIVTPCPDKPTVLTRDLIEACLRQSLHHVQDADLRWAARGNMNDPELREAISEEFRYEGGASHPIWHRCKGGKNPHFHTGMDEDDPLYYLLRGKELLTWVRRILNIPDAPKGQTSMF